MVGNVDLAGATADTTGVLDVVKAIKPENNRLVPSNCIVELHSKDFYACVAPVYVNAIDGVCKGGWAILAVCLGTFNEVLTRLQSAMNSESETNIAPLPSLTIWSTSSIKRVLLKEDLLSRILTTDIRSNMTGPQWEATISQPTREQVVKFCKEPAILKDNTRTMNVSGDTVPFGSLFKGEFERTTIPSHSASFYYCFHVIGPPPPRAASRHPHRRRRRGPINPGHNAVVWLWELQL